MSPSTEMHGGTKRIGSGGENLELLIIIKYFVVTNALTHKFPRLLLILCVANGISINDTTLN